MTELDRWKKFDKIGLGCNRINWTRQNRTGQDWTGMNTIIQDLTGLERISQDLTVLNRTGKA